MSGRSLRRLPLLAHTRFVAGGAYDESETDEEASAHEGSSEEWDTSLTAGEEEQSFDVEELPEGEDGPESLEVWLEALLRTVKAEKAQMSMVEDSINEA